MTKVFTDMHYDSQLKRIKYDDESPYKDYINRMKNFVLHNQHIPGGFYEIEPRSGVPASANEIIKSYIPFYQLDLEQLKIWISFMDFIYVLDCEKTQFVLDMDTMDLRNIVPYYFIKDLEIDKYGKWGWTCEQYLIASFHERYLNEYGPERSSLLEIFAVIKLLFTLSTEVRMGRERDSETFHWTNNHDSFVDMILYFFITSSTLISIDEKRFLIEQLQYNIDQTIIQSFTSFSNDQIPFLIYYFQRSLDSGMSQEEALNLVRSQVVVDKFRL